MRTKWDEVAVDTSSWLHKALMHCTGLIAHSECSNIYYMHDLYNPDYGGTAHKYCSSASRDLTLLPLHHNHNASLKYEKGKVYSPPC